MKFKVGDLIVPKFYLKEINVLMILNVFDCADWDCFVYEVFVIKSDIYDISYHQKMRWQSNMAECHWKLYE